MRMRALVRLIAGGVLLIGLGACTSPAPPRAAGIAPRWTCKASWMARGNPATGLRKPLVTTGTTVLLQSYETVVALNRKTGAVRWRRDPAKTLPLQGSVETWREIVPAGTDIVAVRVVRSSRVSDPTLPAGYRMRYRDLLQAAESSTGRKLWEIVGPLSEDAAATFRPIGVYGGVIAMTGRDGSVTFYDAARGRRVDPAREDGRAALDQAARRSPAPLAAPSLTAPPALLHIATGTVTRVSVTGGVVEGAFCLDNRLLLRVSPEDRPQSGWVVAYDGTGSRLWARGEEDVPAVREAAALDGAGLLAIRESDGALCGISPRDGSVVWRKRLPSLEIVALSVLPDGLFLLAAPPGSRTAEASLAYVDGRTGAFQWLTKVPPSRRLWADALDVFALGEDGNLRCYSRASLFERRKTGDVGRNGGQQ